MKKIHAILSCLVVMMVLSMGAMAQTDPGRTNKTIVADVLAQLPAQNAEKSNALMEELLRTGDEGVTQIVSMMAAPGQGDNTAMEYALSGMARYVMQNKSFEDKRAAFSSSLAKALSATNEDEVKFFVLTQLVLVGKGEAVPAVKACIKNKRLHDVACRALVNIDTPEAKEALKAAGYKTVADPDPAPAADDKYGIAANRVADMYQLVKEQGEAALPQLIKAMKDDDRRYRQAVLNIVANDLKGGVATTALVAGFNKASNGAKVDLMDYFARVGATSAVPAVAKCLKNKNTEVYDKAVSTLATFGGDDALAALAKTFKGSDQDKIDKVSAELKHMDADVPAVLLAGFDKWSKPGKVAAIDLLGYRGATAAGEKVFECLTSEDKDLQDKAYIALAGVATVDDLSRLCDMMDAETDASHISALQAALMATSEAMKSNDRENLFLQRMEQAPEGKKTPYYNMLGDLYSDNAGLLDTYFSLLETDSETAVRNLKKRPDCENVARRSLALAKEKPALASNLLPVIIDRVVNSGLTAERKLLFLRDAFEITTNDNEKNEVLKAVANAKTFQAMMFAGKFLEVPALQKTAARTVMMTGLADQSFNSAEAKALLTRVLDVLEGDDARYEKEPIRQHLAAIADEEGYVSIFNGKDLTGWKGLVENPIKRRQMTEKELAEAQVGADEIMRRDWKVEDGCLVYVGHGFENICTEKQYANFEMLIDWRLDAAGNEPDAGIYLRGTPQVQIWDTARVNVGAQVGSGGLYNNQKNKSIPSHVADNPTGEWNTFRIIMKGEKVSVWLNGDKVVDNVVMENYWDRSQPIPYIDQIELQAHGSKVYYRDIYVKELPSVEPYEVSEAEKKEGFRPLFDGVTMHGWTGNLKDYVAEDGCIVLYPSNGSGGNLYTEEEFSDFVLRFDVWLTPGANNGLGVRTPTEGDAAYVGMELQILDNEDPIYKDLQEYQYHGSVYGVIPAKRGFQNKPYEWNTEEVYFKGNKVRVTLNGTVILEGDISKASKKFTETMDHRNHPGLSNPSGHLGFLGHGSHVKFRNIRIKELKK